MYNTNYFNNRYNPYQQYYVQRPIEQQQPNGIFFNNIRYVNSEDMEKYVVGLGQTDMLINMKDGMVKITSADMTGNTFNRYFSFTEKSLKDNADKKEETNTVDYARKDDLKDFIKTDTLESFSKQLDEKFKEIEKKIKINEIMGDK